MTGNHDESAPTLPGFEPARPDDSTPGYVEAQTLRQIEALTADGWITAHHGGPVALAIVTARRVDRAEGRGAPSGQANLLRALKEIFEILPTPERESSDALDKALSAMMTEDQ